MFLIWFYLLEKKNFKNPSFSEFFDYIIIVDTSFRKLCQLENNKLKIIEKSPFNQPVKRV
jgi:hypothetical protein